MCTPKQRNIKEGLRGKAAKILQFFKLVIKVLEFIMISLVILFH